MVMIMRHTGFLTIICIILIISAGCTAPPSGMSNSQDTLAEPIPTATVVPADTPTAIIDPVPEGVQTSPHKVIYSEKMEFRYNEVNMVVDVPHPPLIIDLNITPEISTRIKEGTSVYGEKKDYRYQIDHVNQNVWFECTVKDKERDAIVVRDGYGRTFSHDSTQEIVIRRSGTYHITFTGNFVTAEIMMRIPEQVEQ